MEQDEAPTLLEMLWRSHLHFSVRSNTLRVSGVTSRPTLLQISQRCVFNVCPLGLFFFGASWGLVRRTFACKALPDDTLRILLFSF